MVIRIALQIGLAVLLLEFLWSQNVGIGTATPQARLDVLGNQVVGPSGGLPNGVVGDLHVGRQQATAGTAGEVTRLTIQPYGHTGGPFRLVARDVPSSAYLDLRYGTSGLVTVMHNGNVGLGAVAPSYRLELLSATARLALDVAGSAGWGPFLNLQRLSDNLFWHISGPRGGVEDGDLTFYYHNGAYNQVLTLQTDGTVGIGTTAPAQRLHVAGNLQFDGALMPNGNSGSTGQVLVSQGAAAPQWQNVLGLIGCGGVATNYVLKWTGSVFCNSVIYDNGTNVGIATTAPSYRLTIAGGSSPIFAVDNGASFVARNAGGTYENYLWPRWTDNIMYLNYGGNGFYIRNNASVGVMFMTPGGNVGIGTTAPLARLHVSGEVMLGNGATDGPRLVWRGGSGGTQEYRARVFTDGRLAFFPCEISTPCYVGEVLALTQNGRVGVQQVTPAYTLHVNGSFAASSKSFDISHPSKPGKRLVHGCLEGPEFAVYYRGRAKLVNGAVQVTLPDYFESLTRKEDRTIHLTAIGSEPYLLSASDIVNGTFTVYGTKPDGEFYWEVKAVRADVPRLQVERGEDEYIEYKSQWGGK